MKSIVVVILALASVLALHAQVSYIVIDLHPDGFTSSIALGVSGGQQVGDGCFTTDPFGPCHALLWTGTADSVVDLNPAGFTSSRAFGVGGGQQVGSGGGHALLWTGTADSVVDLHPDGFPQSFAEGASAGQQVGWRAGLDFHYHALLWTGTADSVVELEPEGFAASFALGVSEGQQVGYGCFGPVCAPPETDFTDSHALLWTGTADRVVDLHPAGFRLSIAHGVNSGQQVGYGCFDTDGPCHALLWTGSAESVVDLHPDGFALSYAFGVSGGQQVGWGCDFPCTQSHALLWTGSADSVVDLHVFLPDGFTWSFANGVDESGNIVGYAQGPATGNQLHAILWQPTAGPLLESK